MSDQTRRAAAEIVAAVTAKMQANIEIVEKSTGYGRLIWRRKSNGQIEIDLETKV